MTESRVEAVARAIDQSGCWETYDDLMRTGGYFPSDGLLDRLDKSKQRAQAAIEANDAWFQTHGWKAVPREHPRGEDRLDLAQAIMADQEMRTWQRLYDLAPSPEEVDR